MKTNLNNILQKCSWRNSQQNCAEQMSDLFAEHRYFNFQDEIQFVSKTTMEYWNIVIQKASVVAIGGWVAFLSLASHYLQDRSLLMSRQNIIFTVFSNLFKSIGTWRALPGSRHFLTDFSDNDQGRCRSVMQTSASALLRGNEWTSLWTCAVTLRLELV